MRQQRPPLEVVGAIDADSPLSRLTTLRSAVESLGVGQLGVRRWGNMLGDGTYLRRFPSGILRPLLRRHPAEMQPGAVLQFLDDLSWIGGLVIQRESESPGLAGVSIALCAARQSFRSMGLTIGLKWHEEGTRPFEHCYVRACFLDKISEFSSEASWPTQIFNLVDVRGPVLNVAEDREFPQRTQSMLNILAAVQTAVERISERPVVRGQVESVS